MNFLSILVTIIALIVVPIDTFVIGMSCMIAALLRIQDKHGSPYDVLPRAWARIMLATTGVRVIVHNAELLAEGMPHIFVANHMSWYDIPVLASFLPRAKFVAKAELFRIPVMGGAMRAVGMGCYRCAIHDLAGVEHEELEHRELFRREVDLLSPT